MKPIPLALGALLSIGFSTCSGAERQPHISQIMATIEQLGPGWASNRVVVLVDPLSLPSVMADLNETPEGQIRRALDVLTKDPRREAYAVLRYYGGSTGLHHTNSLVYITRWKSKADIGNDWGRDNATKDSPGVLPEVGEEVRFSQQHGLNNDISFRRGNYLIIVSCPIAFGVEHLKRLAEVLDDNFLSAQKGSAATDPGP